MNTSRILNVVIACAVALPMPAIAADAFTDGEIVGIVTAANQDELNAAAIAVDKTQNAGVKTFAERMTRDHGGAKQELSEVEAKTGITRSDTALSSDLTKHGTDEIGQLSVLTGVAFDRAYVDAQVSDHAALLKAFDEKLIPDAKNPSVAALLRKLRPVIASHLAKARRLQTELKSAP
jgi:putative membrane protein